MQKKESIYIHKYCCYVTIFSCIKSTFILFICVLGEGRDFFFFRKRIK
jgi:hypothetical protein